LPHLPPVWKSGSTTPDPAYPASMPNAPFAIDEPPYDRPGSVLTVSPVHRFYQNRMQINDGRNDMFVAWTDVGSLVMGHYNPEGTYLYKLAKEFTLTDQFFMAAFGGSNLNHFWLACACSPVYKNAPTTMRAELDDAGNLKLAPASPRSALDGPPIWTRDGSISPDDYVVNTVQPPYQPSAVPPTPGAIRVSQTPPRIRCPRRRRRPSATFCRRRASIGRGMRKVGTWPWRTAASSTTSAA
jgi:acid phosphatase